MPYLSKKFRQNPFTTFSVIPRTETYRQTDRNKIIAFFGGGNKRIEYKLLCLFNHVAVIGVGAQSTLGGTKFLPEKCVLKISKMREFYIIIAGKYFSRILGGRHVPLPPSPTPMVAVLARYSLSPRRDRQPL